MSLVTRGYFVSTVGRDEAVVRNYIQGQEREDRRVDQLKLLSYLPLGGPRFEPTALSGSPIRPPALPEVRDF